MTLMASLGVSLSYNAVLDKQRLIVISYNLHGYNQGLIGLQDLVRTLFSDIIIVQEHWLTNDNLSNPVQCFK